MVKGDIFKYQVPGKRAEWAKFQNNSMDPNYIHYLPLLKNPRTGKKYWGNKVGMHRKYIVTEEAGA